jgi:hypothetical protein
LWRRETYWQGVSGYPRLIINNYLAQPAAVPDTFENTIGLYSNAGLIQVSEGLVTSFSGFITGNAYASVTQVAILTCVDSAGLLFTLRIPAPIKATVFLADAITVDPAVATAVYNAALADQICSPQGNLIAGILTGILNGPAFPGETLT